MALLLAKGTYRPRGPARRCGIIRIDDGITRHMYTCKFVSDGFLQPLASSPTWDEVTIEFFALKPGEAVRTIAAMLTAGDSTLRGHSIVN